LTGRQGRRLKQLLDDRKGIRSYCELKEEPLVCTAWRVGFGGGGLNPGLRRPWEGMEE